MAPLFSSLAGTRKRSMSESHPYRHLLDPNSAYVPMQFFNRSPKSVPLPLSPQPGYAPAGSPYGPPPGQFYGHQPSPGFASPYVPFPWAQWPSPHAGFMELQPPQIDTRGASVHILLAPANPATINQSHILYDIRYKPEKCYMTVNPSAIPIPEDIVDHVATNPPMPKLRLVCHDIPWRITVANAKGVTIRDIIEAIYTEMNQPLTEGEWWIAGEAERDVAFEAYQKNCSDDVQEAMKRKLDDGVKRVDWLGKKTMIMAISRTDQDEDFIKTRVPDKKARAETWVLDLGDAY